MKDFLKATTAKAWPVWLTLISRLGVKTLSGALEKRLQNGTPAETLVLAVTPPLLNTIDVLSDQDPDNQAQVEKIWKSWVHEFMVPFLFGLFKPTTEKIKQDYNKAFVQFLMQNAQIITGFLTDEIEPNQAQITAFGRELLKDPETKTILINQFIAGNMQAANLNKDLITFVTVTIGIAYDAVVHAIEQDQLNTTQVTDNTVTFESADQKVTIESK